MKLTDLRYRDCILHGNKHDCLGSRTPTPRELVKALGGTFTYMVVNEIGTKEGIWVIPAAALEDTDLAS